MLRSDPSLKKLFDRAVKHTYTPARFIAELRQTKWFRSNSDAMRNYEVLKRTDPRTYEAKLNQTMASVRDMSTQLGSRLGNSALKHIAENVMRYGWNDAQIRDTLSQSIKLSGGGQYGGQAAVNADTLQKLAYNNGVKIGKDQLNTWLQRMGAGEDISGFENYVQKMAMSAFPGFQKELTAGMSVRDLADPYIQSMAQTLELNSQDLDLFDPTIRQALNAKDAEGKIGMKPLWQFETELRKDPRWFQTKNSQDTLNGIGHGLLQQFGLMT